MKIPEDRLKTEADLRRMAMERLIAASVSHGDSVREDRLQRWRRVSAQTQDNRMRQTKEA